MSFTTPYYLITSCCPQATLSDYFHIPGLGTVPDGTYQYTGTTFTDPTTGMTFDFGFCYTVQFIGNNSGYYPPAFNSGSLLLRSDCDDPYCAPCDSKLPAFSVFNCCDTANVVNLNINPETCIISDGVWIYNNPIPYVQPISGFIFTPGDCYTVTEIADGAYEAGPDCTDFTITSYDTCQLAASDGLCPACDLALEFLIFTSCCDDTEILFKGPFPVSTYTGIREYLGVPIDGLENLCYRITSGVVGDIQVPDVAAYNLLPDPPVYVENLTFSQMTADSNVECSVYVDECPSCIKQCYTLYDCDGNHFNTEIDLSTYLNTFITIIQGGVSSGPWYVLENNSGSCDGAVTGFTVDPVVPDPCDCNCYSVIANAKNCVYVDCDGNLQNTGLLVGTLVEFCSIVYPFIQSNVSGSPIFITNNGLCVNDECPILCYKLEDCDNILPDIYTNNTSLGIYAIIGAVVIIEGYPDTCWEVTDTVECDCAINVTVFQYFLDCPTCKGIPKYKLTNCDDPLTIVYTSSNLSAYVNQVIIRLDCEGCWLVEEVDLIPSDVVITVDTSYIDCVSCARTYYLLRDCSRYLPDVITYTDLSAYVGDVIKLEYCPETCWEVFISRDPTDAGEVIFLDQRYSDCKTCLATLPCICTTVRNDDTKVVSNEYTYIDCDFKFQNFRLLFGETSPKFCMIAWSIYSPETDYIETFGDCSKERDQDPWTCPPPIYPRRFIRPGYYVPTCSIEKFEKITCKAAEAMYKKVLEQRYGISNCCPEDDSKWLIKKELIDLAGLVDPAYTCVPIQSCCNDAPNCGCTSVNTCNS